MGVRENKVETYLKTQFKELGGITRKWKSPGVDGVPDQICILNGEFYLVEVKTTDGPLSTPQEREHTRLRKHGVTVTTVYSFTGVSDFIADIIYKNPIKHEYR